MRDGMTPDVLSAIGASAITTAYLARLEFLTETCLVWTGQGSIQVTGSGDSLLDGNTFDAIAYGVAVDVGENSFSYSGSDELPIILNIPTQPDPAISAASANTQEYRTRPATIWRAILLPSSDPLAPPTWLFRRIRSGRMDQVEVTNDGSSHTFKLVIESHQGLITNASNQTYLNQKRYDPADTSQDFAVSIANGDPAPSKGPVVTGGYGAAGKFFDDGGYSNINVQS